MKESVSILVSNKCQLNCSYCRLEKNDDFMQKKVIESFKTKSIYKHMKNIMPNLTTISLWGGEPTYNLNLVTDDLPYIVKEFPNLKEIKLSTNLMDTDALISFVKASSKYDFSLGVQLSIDGQYELTKLNRGMNDKTTDVIYTGLESFIEAVQKTKYKNLKIRNKVTWDPTTFTFLAKSESLLRNYFVYMNNLRKKIKDLGYTETFEGVQPTLSFPGTFTKEQSDDFKTVIDYIREYRKQEKSITIKYPSELLFAQSFLNLPDFIRSSDYGACSAGKSTVALDVEGTALFCHPFFFSQQKGRSQYSYDADSSRFDYITNGSRKFVSFKLALSNMLILELLYSRQISDVYHNEERRKLLAALSVGFSCCRAEMINFGSANLIDLNLLRLVGYTEYDKYIAEVLCERE